jgi:hypothetical protein
LLRAQAGYYVLTGVWPLLDMRTFQAFTGPKASPWLVKTVGALVAVVGVALESARRRDRIEFDTALLSFGSAAALCAVDVRYALTGRIAKTYLADGAAQALVLAGWIRVCRQTSAFGSGE